LRNNQPGNRALALRLMTLSEDELRAHCEAIVVERGIGLIYDHILDDMGDVSCE